MHDPWVGLLLGTLLVMLLVADVSGIQLLRRHGAFARFQAVDDLAAVAPAHDPRGLEALAQEFQGGDYLRLLEQVMNRVDRCEEGPSTNIRAVVDHIRNGRGLLCPGMASLYSNVLWLNGIRARQVYLTRALFGSVDTHVT
ncbi:MAG TPA: hypothetical protein VLM91_13005, partial [Candidatus Methylomirabilis sp.]|nr:hypothetical protein [Candidatus Methylomirabilis sp.]